MKLTLAVLALFVLCATGGFAQFSGSAAVAPTMSTIYSPPNHAEQAMHSSLGDERSLLDSNTVAIGHGEMPLWEVPLASHDVPLGTSAREQKQEHANDKKSTKVWVN